MAQDRRWVLARDACLASLLPVSAASAVLVGRPMKSEDIVKRNAADRDVDPERT